MSGASGVEGARLARAKLLELAARSGGVEAVEVDAAGIAPKTVRNQIAKLCAQGLLCVGARGHRTKRYFSNQPAADAWAAMRKTASSGERSRANGHKLDPTLPVVIPPHVKVQVCPGYRGGRYAPSENFERVITGDWMLRRQVALAAKCAVRLIGGLGDW